MKEIRIRLLAVLGALALVVAACGNGEVVETTTTAPPDDDVTTTAPDTTEPTEPDDGEELTDAIGIIEVNPGESIQIRAHQAISGPVEFLGVDQVRGIELAIEDFGDIHGFPVDLGTPEDDLCRAEGGVSGSQAIVAQDRVVAVIGTTCSGAAAAAIPIYSAAGILTVSGSNTSPGLTSYIMTDPGVPGENYHEGYFRTAHNDEFQGGAVGEFIFNELGLTRAAAIHDGDPYTQGLATAFRERFESAGGEVPLFTAVDPDQTDMTAVLTDVAAADVEVVYFPIFQPAGDFIITQKDGIAGLEDVTWFGADGLFVEDYLGIPETEGMYFSGPDLDFGANVSATGVAYSDMRERYIENYGEAPLAAFHAHTYDATVMVLSAIQETAVLGDDGVLRIPQQGLRDFMLNLTDFPGMIGTLSCDEFGDCGAQTVQIALHEDSSVTDLADVPVAARYTADDLR